MDAVQSYVLQCVAVCCSVLQCVAVCCSVLQCVAVCCSHVCCSAALDSSIVYACRHAVRFTNSRCSSRMLRRNTHSCNTLKHIRLQHCKMVAEMQCLERRTQRSCSVWIMWILRNTATHCNTLRHVATRCNTLEHAATHCNMLQHTASHCNAAGCGHCRLPARTPRILHREVVLYAALLPNQLLSATL